jgi:hypothetical protein
LRIIPSLTLCSVFEAEQEGSGGKIKPDGRLVPLS